MSGVKVRKMQASDMAVIMQIKTAENWNQTEADWQFLMTSNPELCFVAVLNNEVIGTVTAINYQHKIAWIGMMLVSKLHRGKGVGKMLLNTIIEKLKGCGSIKLDATPRGIPVYKKLGFVEEYKITRMVSQSLGNLKQPENSSPVISQILENNLDSLVSMDEMVFGANRYRLLHFLLNNQKNIALQIRNDEKLRGFLLGRKGSNYVQVGPVVANDMQSAKLLLHNVFITLRKTPAVLDVLLDKSELIDWLLSVGFRHQRNFTRMYLHSNKYLGKTKNQFLISGPELG